MIQRLALHKVGNRTNEEGIIESNKELVLEDEILDLLEHYFTNSFKDDEFYKFTHQSDINLNDCYHYVKAIFDDPEQLLEQSKQLTNHLYNESTHPNIKAGEFYTVYFKDSVLDDEVMDCIGLFKSENKDTFLQVYPKDNSFQIDKQEGININKLDKGCLIFNADEEDGYIVSIVDRTNKSSEAQYWVDDFLKVIQREDRFYNTAETMTMYKKFVHEHLPNEFEMSKVDQAGMLNKTMDYFKENEEFSLVDFATEVLEQQEVIDEFKEFKTTYENERDIQVAENFAISDNAVKKQNKNYKSVIKLDKNFHVYVHGDNNKIVLDEDEQGKHYKLYFDQES